MPIITRAEWGAEHPNGFGPRKLPATQAWLHHSAGLAPDLVPPFDDDYQAIRDLEAIGEARFGGGISYTRLITPVGLIFEGHSIDRVGSHTANRNTVAVGYCLVGNYTVQAPTAAQLYALAWCIQHDHRNGWLDQPQLDGGHRDLKATQCPGDHAYVAIPNINRLAAGPPLEDNDMQLSDTIPNLTGGKAVTVEAVLAKIYRDHAIALPISDRPREGDADDMLGHILNVDGRLKRLEAKVDQLVARPAADVDETALAAELVARGIGGVSAAELIEILGSVRLTAGQTPQS